MDGGPVPQRTVKTACKNVFGHQGHPVPRRFPSLFSGATSSCRQQLRGWSRGLHCWLFAHLLVCKLLKGEDCVPEIRTQSPRSTDISELKSAPD